MPDPWYEYAIWDPGRASGYRLGRNRMRSVKCHYTVGRDSWGLIKNEGLAQFLVTRDGRVAQFAEVDALCYDSGEWNDDGPGIEIEFYDEPEGIFTDAARDATSDLISWLNEEWSMPLEYYDGDRLPEGSWNGFISHRSLIQSQPHSDYWPREDWDRMIAENPPGDIPQEEDIMYIAVGDVLMGRVAAVIDGGYRIGDYFTGSINTAVGIPNSAIDWNSQGGRNLRYVYFEGDNDRYAELTQRRPPGT